MGGVTFHLVGTPPDNNDTVANGRMWRIRYLRMQHPEQLHKPWRRREHCRLLLATACMRITPMRTQCEWKPERRNESQNARNTFSVQAACHFVASVARTFGE